MADERPNSAVQAAAQIAESAVNGLKGSPLILGLLLLNAIGIGAAIWFLSSLASAQAKRVEMVLSACLPHIGGKP
jgi:hypothetical protein